MTELSSTAFRLRSLFLLIVSAGIFHMPLAKAQVYFPADGIVYGDLEIPRIDITISEGDLADLYANPASESEKKVDFTFSGNGVTESLTDVGMRCKGNTSLNNRKKSFKLSFNTFVSGRKFHEVEKLNISAEVNDPSMLRANLCWKLYRKLGMPAPRSNHIRLYINGSFYGIYHNVEQIDENLMKSRLGAGYGNLYKCLWPADLAYLGSDPESYKYYSGDRQPYDLQVNEEYDDYADLAEMITKLNNLTGTDFRNTFERYFNVQSLLKVLALDVMTGNWDDYIFNKNNYYLYRDPLTGRFELFPYDMDNTFGIDWVGKDWGTRSVYTWHSDTRPLYTKILSYQDYRAQYTAYLQEIGALMESDWFRGEMDRIRALIRTYLSSDTYYPKDYGYSVNDFENTLTTAWGGQVKYGILNYITTRVNSMKAETGTVDALPVISYFRTSVSGDSCSIAVSAEDDRDAVSMTLHFRMAGGAWQTETLTADPLLYDSHSGRKQYRSTLKGIPEAGADLYVTATAGSASSSFPADAMHITVPGWSGPLLINEFMASNQSSISDEFGEYDDWLEVYNAGNSSLHLEDFFLSDEADNPDKYRFPPVLLQPGAFRLVWLDGQADQGPDHAPFSLKQEGEVLRISMLPSTGFAISDFLSYGVQQTDKSFGRAQDGASSWASFISSTPGYSNLSTGLTDNIGEESFRVYPNPVSGGPVHFSKTVTVRVYDLSGRMIMFREDSDGFDATPLAPGLYLIRTGQGEVAELIVR
ncbi:MAG: CotH kinase family protein [Bacteroidota bacterium]